MVDPATVQQLAGALLAQGYSHTEAVENLCSVVPGLTPGDAHACIKRIYTVWRQTGEELDLNSEDHRNWHVHLRQRLLREAIKDPSAPCQRLALSILDSLATIQGLKNIQERELLKPLTLMLVPKQEE